MAQEKRLKDLDDERVSESKDSTKIPAIFKLNDDCLLHVFSFLRIKERLRIQRVCKKWHALLNLPWSDIHKLEINFGYNSYDQNIKFNLPILKQILKHCGSSLTDIKLFSSKGKGLNKPVIVLLTKKCPNVRSLDVTDLTVTRKMMESIADFHNLTHLAIGECWKNCHEMTTKIFSSNKNLRSVEFARGWIVTERCLLTLPVTIESVALGYLCGFGQEIICQTLSKLSNLRVLNIESESLARSTDKFLLALPIKSNLEELHLPRQSGYSVPPQPQNTILNFSFLANLRKLSMGAFILNDDQLLIVGQHCRGLTEVTLSHSRDVTDCGMCGFLKLLNLEKLNILRLNKITNKSLSCIHMSSLKRFFCVDCAELDDEGFHMLMLGAENLEHLKLVDQTSVSLDRLTSHAMHYTKYRDSEKVLKITYQNDVFKPQMTKVSSRVMVETLPLNIPRSYYTPSESSSYEDDNSSDDSSSI